MRVPTRRSEKQSSLKIDPHLTKPAYEKLQTKLTHLKKVTRLRLMDEVATLAAGGDFSENTAYQIAKGRLRGVNSMILEIEARLRQAVIIKTSATSEIIALGSTVTIEAEGKRKKYTILGSAEVNPVEGIISHNSPLGLSLIGKRVGDSLTFSTNTKNTTATVIAID